MFKYDYDSRVSIAASTVTVVTTAVAAATVAHFLMSKRRQKMIREYFRTKTILLTGGSLGLGRGIAEELYKAGAQLILCARNLDDLNDAKNHLISLCRPPAGNKVPEVLQLDVGGDADTIRSKMDEMFKKFDGRIDILINNAGNNHRGEAFEASETLYKNMMQVNFIGPIILTNHFLKSNAFKDRHRQFTLVNIGSVQSYLALPHRAAFGASKHALLAYSDSLRAELFDWPNINVITVQPGYIDVAKVARVLDNHGKPTASAADENIPKKHADAFSPNYVGLKIMKAIVDGGDQEILIVTFVQRLGIWIRFFFPRLFFSFMKLRAKRSIQNNFHY